MALEQLSVAVRRELESRQLSQATFAASLGVSSPTLRTWLRRNCFPRLSVELIIHEFDWKLTVEQAQEAYAFELARPSPRSMLYEGGLLRAAFSTADRECERVALAMTQMAKMITKLCAAMGENDLLIILSATLTPLEMERHLGHAIREAIFEGASRGGTYLYLRPKQDLLDRYMGEPWKFDRIPSQEACRKGIETLRDFIKDKLLICGLTEEKAIDKAIRATPQYHVDEDIPFLVPGFAVMMFRAGGYPGSEEDRLIVRLPDNAWAMVYLTRAEYFHDRFRRVVCEVLKRELAQLTEEKANIEKKGRPTRGQLETARAASDRDLEVLEKIRHLMDM